MSVTQQSTQQTAHPRHRIQAVPPRHATLRRDSVVVTFLVLAVIAVITLGKSFIEIPGVIDASAKFQLFDSCAMARSGIPA